MKYLIFNTEQKAKDALKQINSNMSLPKKGINAKTRKIENKAGLTTDWANIERRSDGKYVMCKPESEYMTDVSHDGEAEFDKNWFKKTQI